MKITADRLRELLDYDSLTGVFRWKVDRCRSAKAGDEAGSYHDGFRAGGGGYRYIGIDRATYSAHRLAWLHVHGIWPVGQLDHVNMDRLDNRIANLRDATRSQNCANREKQSRNTSGFKGVSLQKKSGKFMANVGRRYIGSFDSAEAAHAAYCAEAIKQFGEFART